jgi:hypothetical protein
MARPLTKRERNLAILFGATLFLLANLFGVAALWRKQDEFAANLLTLQNQRDEQRSWLDEKDLWQQRKQWLADNQPVLKSVGEANAELLDNLSVSAGKLGVTINEKAFVEPDPHQKAYQQIAVHLKVTGAKDAVTQWLWELQQPQKFQAIPSLSMKLDNDSAKLDCDLTVARYYAPAR